jgi:hypothetical protein
MMLEKLPPPASPSQNGAKLRNLSLRPPRPSRLRGPVQRGVWRALVVSGRDLTTSELMEFTHALALHRGKNSKRKRENHCRAIRRAAVEIAVQAGRQPTFPRAWVWRLRPEYEHCPPWRASISDNPSGDPKHLPACVND